MIDYNKEITLINPKDNADTYRYRFWQYCPTPTIDALKKKYEDDGKESWLAYNLALSDYKRECVKPVWRVHKITEEEKKKIPKWVKDKPHEQGPYYWRAPSFQWMTESSYYDMISYNSIVLLLLGNLREGDLLPCKLVPEKIGHSMKYIKFVKYKHSFPTRNEYIHTDSLYFEDTFGKNIIIKNLPNYSYLPKNMELISNLESITSYWSMCRLNYEEPLFGDLFNIIKREYCFYQGDLGELLYKENFSPVEWKDKPISIRQI